MRKEATARFSVNRLRTTNHHRLVKQLCSFTLQANKRGSKQCPTKQCFAL